MFWKTFRLSIIISLLALGMGYFYGGWAAFATVALLGIMEISLSADNAVVSARIVAKLSPFWQKLFLTVGIFFAVFVVRFGAPILIVSAVSGLSPVGALSLAMEKGPIDTPGTYAYIMHHEHPTIAAFGGLFLLLITLHFLFEKKDVYWLSWLEKPLAKVGNIDNAALIVALSVLAIITAATADLKVASAGLAGIITYFVVSALGSYFEHREEEAKEKDENAESEGEPGLKNGIIGLTGKAAFFSFLYLEVLDGSFSLDGVVAAFSVTSDPILIALGLGFIGALFVRSTTIYLVRAGTLDDFVYLDHGAHWAIGSLATLLFISMVTPIPELITGTVSVAILGASLIASIRRNKRLARENHADEITANEHVGGLGQRHVQTEHGKDVATHTADVGGSAPDETPVEVTPSA